VSMYHSCVCREFHSNQQHAAQTKGCLCNCARPYRDAFHRRRLEVGAQLCARDSLEPRLSADEPAVIDAGRELRSDTVGSIRLQEAEPTAAVRHPQFERAKGWW
jgi:hypothetical protein